MLTYDPSQVSVIFGGQPITGFADGTFVQLERDEDAYALSIGIDGEGTRAKSNNKSGKATLTLQQSSPSNDYLTGIAKLDELRNAGVLPLLIKDNSGRTLAMAEKAYIVKLPASEFSREVSEREWIIQTDRLELFVGGNVSA